MPWGFNEIPEVVIDYIRGVFALANEKVSRTMDVHPAMHEETFDHVLIMELTAAPPAFFAKERIGVAIESHWLGGRRMWDRWEIADIAIFVILRRSGHLQNRKVALLQTKRLYSRDVAAPELEGADYKIGIGRIVDRTDPLIPMSSRRRFNFDGDSIYSALRAGERQIGLIKSYYDKHGIPVYYGFYNPTTLPYSADYPASAGMTPAATNAVGFRVLPFEAVHSTMSTLPIGQAPTADNLTIQPPLDPADPESRRGWRLERFVADEVLRCRQGRLFDDTTDPNLRSLLYERSAPIQSAISITIDLAD